VSITKLAKAAKKIREARLKKSAEEAKKVRKEGKSYDKKVRKKNIKSAKQGVRPESKRKLARSSQVRRRNQERKTPQGNLREPFEEEALSFKLGGVVKKTASSLINKYKPKLKNQKEDYGLYSKQDYSGVIKEAEKTKKRIQRNRKVAGTAGGATAATVVASNVKDKK